MKRRINIDAFEGLRFLFAVTIFLNHCTFLKENSTGELIFERFFHNGAFGVTFYFVLSGFCLFLGYGDRFETIGIKQYLQFVINRIRKIYPLYMLTNLYVFIYEVVSGYSIVKGIAKLAVSATMLQALSFKYWNILNSAGWFVSTIFICYLLIPVVIHFMHKLEKNKWIFTCLVACIVGISLMVLGTQWLVSKEWIDTNTGVLLTYTFPFFRIFFVIAGMFLAKIFVNRFDKKIKNVQVVEGVTVIVVCIAYYTGINGGYIEQYKEIYYLLALMLLIYIFAYEQGRISRFFGNTLCVKLGKLSFELYLIHYVVINYGGAKIMDKILRGEYNVIKPGIEVLVLFLITMLLACFISGRNKCKIIIKK